MKPVGPVRQRFQAIPHRCKAEAIECREGERGSVPAHSCVAGHPIRQPGDREALDVRLVGRNVCRQKIIKRRSALRWRRLRPDA